MNFMFMPHMLVNSYGRAGQLGLYIPETTSKGTTLTLDNIFNTAASLASQIISAATSKPNTQITSSANGVLPISNPSPNVGYNPSANNTVNTGANSNSNNNDGAGATALKLGSSFFDQLAASFGISTSTLMLLGIGGAYLLFKDSPRSRR